MKSVVLFCLFSVFQWSTSHPAAESPDKITYISVSGFKSNIKNTVIGVLQKNAGFLNTAAVKIFSKTLT